MRKKRETDRKNHPPVQPDRGVLSTSTLDYLPQCAPKFGNRLGVDYGAQGVGFTGEVLTLEKIDTPGPLLTCGAFLELVNGNCISSGF